MSTHTHTGYAHIVFDVNSSIVWLNEICKYSKMQIKKII